MQQKKEVFIIAMDALFQLVDLLSHLSIQYMEVSSTQLVILKLFLPSVTSHLLQLIILVHF